MAILFDKKLKSIMALFISGLGYFIAAVPKKTKEPSWLLGLKS